MRDAVIEFLVHCYDTQTVHDLADDLQAEPDFSVLEQWDINAVEWREAKETALDLKLTEAATKGELT